jgi:hypothetical protein
MMPSAHLHPMSYLLIVTLKSRYVVLKEQDLGIWNHLGAVMNWLLGSWGRPYAPGEAPGAL